MWCNCQNVLQAREPQLKIHAIFNPLMRRNNFITGTMRSNPQKRVIFIFPDGVIISFL
jgi:hypothetical protein